MWGERRRRQKGTLPVSVEPQPVIGRPLGLTHAGGREQGCSQVRIALLSFKVQGESCRRAVPASLIKRKSRQLLLQRKIDGESATCSQPSTGQTGVQPGSKRLRGALRPASPATARRGARDRPRPLAPPQWVHRPPPQPGTQPGTGSSPSQPWPGSPWETASQASTPRGHSLLGVQAPEGKSSMLSSVALEWPGEAARLCSQRPLRGAVQPGLTALGPVRSTAGGGAPRVSGRAGGSPAGQVAALPLSAPGF